jgi:hypothetical protein
MLAEKRKQTRDEQSFSSQMRVLLDEFRITESVRLGSTVESVAWFVDLGVPVCNRALSFSSTMSSPSCVASFVLFFLLVAMETPLAAHALDVQEGVTTGAVRPNICML